MLRGKIFICLLLGLLLAAGCGKKEENLENIEFTVLPEEQIPEQLRLMIEERKEAPFELSYQDGDLLYLAVGYGTQDSGGYSIQVPAFYRTENELVLDTELLGPQTKPSGAEAAKSCPYIVIMTEFRDEPIRYE